VPAHPFEFSIELVGPGKWTGVLRELTVLAFGHVGRSGPAVETTAAALQAAATDAGTAGSVRVSFRATASELEVTLSSGARPVWRETQSIT
jgi:hypothetical protein